MRKRRGISKEKIKPVGQKVLFLGKGPISISAKKGRGSRKMKATNAGNCRDVDHETLKKFHTAGWNKSISTKEYRQKWERVQERTGFLSKDELGEIRPYHT
jgi:hypothetical protein